MASLGGSKWRLLAYPTSRLILYSPIFRLRVFRWMPSVSAVLVRLPSDRLKTRAMNRFSNSRTASSKWTPLSTISSTSFSSRSAIIAAYQSLKTPAQRRVETRALRLQPSDLNLLSFQFAAGQASKSFQIFFTRFHRDVVGQRRHRRLFVPPNGLEIVADVLLVEAWLWPAGRVAVARPEARRVRRERFIDEHNTILRFPRSGKHTELEFGVGNNDSDGFGVRRSLRIELERQGGNPGRQA